MVKTLLRKQAMQMTAFLFRSGKSGKRRSTAGVFGYGLLLLYCLVVFVGMFYAMASALCGPLHDMDLDWLYFAMMGIIALAVGLFGSIFSTYSALYQGKDNELLLSMPIPPYCILLVRMVGCFVSTLLFVAVVYLPGVAAYMIHTGGGISFVAAGLLGLFVLTIFSLSVSCILGYGIAVLSTRVRKKNLVSVVLSLVFFAVYFYLINNANSLLQNILLQAERLGGEVKPGAYPLNLLGRALSGEVVPFLGISGAVLAFFTVVYWSMSRSFLRLSTARRGEKRTAYRDRTHNQHSLQAALFSREWRRYLSSSTYMLNCSMGTVFMLVGGAAVLIKGDMLREMAGFLSDPQLVLLIAAAMVCMCTTMNDLTAPSVSLEGKRIWILHALPVSSWQVLKAKLMLHLILTVPPMVLLTVCLSYVLGLSMMAWLLILVTGTAFVILNGCFGLMLNLKLPNLDWDREVVAVKQGISVGIALFGSWAILALLALGYLLLRPIGALTYLPLCLAVFLSLDVVFYLWLRRRGTEIFESL